MKNLAEYEDAKFMTYTHERRIAALDKLIAWYWKNKGEQK